jgi:hypothetical protein
VTKSMTTKKTYMRTTTNLIKIDHHHSWLLVVATVVEHHLTVSPLVLTLLPFKSTHGFQNR